VTTPDFPDDFLGPNIFPESDSRHELWRKAARLAAEDDARHRAAILARDLTALATYLDLYVGWYDIRAKWLAFVVVFNYASIPPYQEALNRLRTAVLEWAENHSPRFIRERGLRADLRQRLNQRSVHWLAESMRLAREYEEVPVTPAFQPTLKTVCRWSDLRIEFVSDERVQLSIVDRPGTYNYGEMGFENRTTKRPNLAWSTLRLLAENAGVLRKPRGGKWSAVEKQVQEIRRRLRVFLGQQGCEFPSDVDPIPFVRGEGYRTAFAIGVRPSYET
jgi:hypothetical protein